MKFSIPLGLVLILSAGIPAGAGQQQEPSQQESAPSRQQMRDECERMMQMHAKMMTEVEQMETRLSTLVEQMNAAEGDEKVEATARVVNELAEQRQKSLEWMTEMQPRMMQHMMLHMQMGAQEGGSKGMMEACPMMQKMRKEPVSD